MTIITLKALSKITAVLATSALLSLPNVTSVQAKEVTFDDGHLLSVCVMDGGVVVNSGGVTSCWNPVTDEITDCDNSQRGEPDGCYTEPVTSIRDRGGKLDKSVLSTDVMIMQPDTNSTVGTRAKPAGGKLSRRVIKRN